MKFLEFLKDQSIFENGYEDLQPEVSIVMPTYNREDEELLIPCIELVLAQSFKAFEFIIVNDGSSDGTRDVVTEYALKDKRIVFVDHEENSGLPAVRADEGILLARAPYITFIFDDNNWNPEALELLMGAMATSGADLVYGEMALAQERKPYPVLGRMPVSLELMQNLNMIPNGAVLCRRLFFDSFGLYDPHLLLRRIYDWDLWLRALKHGARFHHLARVIGEEHGLASPQSLGNSIRYDYKVVAGLIQDEHRQTGYCAALNPEHISEYDVSDPEIAVRYLRSYAEWDKLEDIVYAPYRSAHPEYEVQPLIRHNRRTDAGLLGYRLNGLTSIFRDRKRVLLIANRFTRLVHDWYEGLSQDPQNIVISCNELGTQAFLPEEIDQILLFDCASLTLLPFIQQCRKRGVSAVYIVEHGMDKSYLSEFDPLSFLDFTEDQTIKDEFKTSLYFAHAGRPWPETLISNARVLFSACDQAFSIQSDAIPPAEDVFPIPFIPNALPVEQGDAGAGINPPAFYLGTLNQLAASVLIGLQTALEELPFDFRWKIFVSPVGGLPEWLLALAAQKKIVLIVTRESLLTLASLHRRSMWIVPGEIMDRYPSYHRQLIEEDLAMGGGALVDLLDFCDTLVKCVDDPGSLNQVFMQLAGDLRKKVQGRGNGFRCDARRLHLQNILAGVALRKQVADWRSEPGARSVKSLVMVNSQLFGGSEMYGFLVAKVLAHIGFDVRVCIPEWDQYGSGSDSMEAWLRKNRLLPPLKVEYSKAAYALYQEGFLEEPVIEYSEDLSERLDGYGAGLVFCSGFIAEPVIAWRDTRLIFMGLFPPWGYALKRMTFARDRIDGLVSDSKWAAELWGEWIAPPVVPVLSLIEPEYFIVRNKDLPQKPVSIAVVGTMLSSKRQKEVLLAFQALVEEGYDLRLNFYGSELDVFAPYIKELKGLAGHEQLKGRVFFNGYVEDPAEISLNNHLIVSASGDESIPQGMAFNQAAGLVPVACPAGGIPEVVRDGETGFLARGFKIEDIAEALRRALEKQADWPQMIARGRQLLIDECSEQIFVQKLLGTMLDGASIHMAEGNQLFTASSPDPLRFPREGSAMHAARQGVMRLEIVDPPKMEKASHFVIGPDLCGSPTRYFLHAGEDNLAGLEFRVGTFNTAPKGNLKLKIKLDGSTRVLREIVTDAGEIVDNAWVRVSFDPPLEFSAGRSFVVTVTANLRGGRLALYQQLPPGSDKEYLNIQVQRALRRAFRLPLVQAHQGVYPYFNDKSKDSFGLRRE